MPASLILACVWALLAFAAALAPQRFHWPAAWALIATGIPLLGWVTFQAGPFWGLLVLTGGASVLRWPLMRAGQEIRRVMAGQAGGDETEGS